jgi:formylglycine-generating enzyme required for sulfatase activity
MADARAGLDLVHDLTPARLRRLQSDVAQAAGLDVFFRDVLATGAPGPELAVIPPGLCDTGTAEAERYFGDLPKSRQHIDTAYAIGRHTITADDFALFTETTGFYWRDDLVRAEGRLPVINVSQGQAIAYLDWLSAQTGQRYRLPSELEWEYAARSGSPDDYCFGARLTCGDANVQTFQATGAAVKGWRRFLPFCAPLNRAVEVATYPANIWGLYEVHGNVWEFTLDTWRGPVLPGRGEPKRPNDWIVVKGGSWFEGLAAARAASRQARLRSEIDVNLGFRVVRELSPAV